MGAMVVIESFCTSSGYSSLLAFGVGVAGVSSRRRLG